MPKFDGILCSDETNFCDNILLIKDGKIFGISNYAFNELFFDDQREKGTYVIISDTDKDGYFEQWNYASNYSEYIYYDLDKDYRADWLTQLSEGNIIDEHPLSGVVSVRFSAAIKNAADFFSEPDAFLILIKNGHLVGRSKTVENNTYPSFPDNFIIDYKHKDDVTIDIYDRDIFSHDYIDSVTLKDLPESGYLITNKKQVVLAMNVIPSDRPEGVYALSDNQENINPFETPSWKKEHSEIANIVNSARKERARANVMSMVGSFVAPEIILGLTLRPVTFFNAFVMGVTGQLTTYELLTHR